MENKFIYGKATLNDFRNTINHHGWVIFENALPHDMVELINNDLAHAYRSKSKSPARPGHDANGNLSNLLQRDNFSIAFLEKLYCYNEIRSFLDGDYILNGLNAKIGFKPKQSTTGNLHRGIRAFVGDAKVFVHMIVTLDDFTATNGATYFLSGSQKSALMPDETYFYNHADRAITGKGSIILFDSNIWLAAGENHTSKLRRELMLNFACPFIKPDIDYPELLGIDFVSKLSPELRQIISYNNHNTAQHTNNYYHQPPHLRVL